jgi:hypothetical protein
MLEQEFRKLSAASGIVSCMRSLPDMETDCNCSLDYRIQSAQRSLLCSRVQALAIPRPHTATQLARHPFIRTGILAIFPG